MASLTIRDLDEETRERLRVRAALRRRSMGAEARYILREALAHEETTHGNLADAIRKRFRALGGATLPIAEREPIAPR